MELTIDQALQKGIEAHMAGRVQEADQYYTAIIKANPKHPDANHNMGVLAVGVGKASEALLFFEIAVEANPNKAQFWLSYIDTLLKLDKVTDAQAVLVKARINGIKGKDLDRIEEKLSSLRQLGGKQTKHEILNKAIKLRESGKYDEVIDLLVHLAKTFPTDTNIQAILSHSYILNDDLEQAKIYLDAAKNINPNNALVGWNETRLLLKQKKIKEALSVAEKTNESFPDDIEGMGVLGSCLRQVGRFVESQKILNKAISFNPNYAEALINRGLIYLYKKDKVMALIDLEKAHHIKPHLKQIWHIVLKLKMEVKDFENTISLAAEMLKYDPLDDKVLVQIAVCHHYLQNYDQAILFYKKSIKINQDNFEAYNNMGVALKKQGRLEEAIEAYNEALSIKPNYAEAYSNMGLALQDQGKLKDAVEAFKKALSIKPDYAEACNNMGVALQDQGKLKDAAEAFKKALSIKPDYADAYFNCAGTALYINEAKDWVAKCLAVNPQHLKARLILSALKFYEGDKAEFDKLINSALKNHSFTRSFTWAFSLPKLPPLHFNRWALFDQVTKLSKKDRPFYEFGVWRGEAFKYLIKTFKKGYGFDTFEGIPEDWHNEKAGTYSSYGNVPKIKGGEFITGKFENTLPVFFEKSRPMASIINFDADLYSSTICALTHAKPVIDKHTILIFDEFIINKNWEQDEYKALEEFCAVNDCTYEVIAISFFTKQVAVKMVGI